MFGFGFRTLVGEVPFHDDLISGPPTPPTVRKRQMKNKGEKETLHHPPEGKTKEKIHSRAGLGPPPLRSRPPPSPLGALSRLPRTPPSGCAKIPTRRPWPSPPTDTVSTGLVAPHSKASPISFHNLLVYSRHAGHLVKRWCLDWGSPLAHHQQSGVSVRPKRWRWVPVSAWPDSSW